MIRRSTVAHRRRLTVAVAAVALGLSGTSAALASAPYTVKVKVNPSSVGTGSTFKVTASGASHNSSQLTIFLNPTSKCAKTAATEASNHSDSRVMNVRISGTFKKAKTVTAGATGDHFACTYLSAPASSKAVRAHAATSYTVLGFY